MIFPFLFATIFAIFSLKSLFREVDSFLSFCGISIVYIICTIMAFFVGALFSLVVGLAVPKQWSEPETAKLVHLRDSDGINGSSFLGTGSIQSTQYYFYYKADENSSGYKPDKVAVDDNITVFEEERSDGELKVYTYRFTNDAFEWVAFEFTSEKYEFHIPKGTIKQNFVLQ